MICNKSRAEMLLKPIKTESYGVLRHKPFHPSLSANIKRGRHQRCQSLFHCSLFNIHSSTIHSSQSEWAMTHTRCGRNGGQEGRERGYYDLHRNLNKLLLHHTPLSFSCRRQGRDRSRCRQGLQCYRQCCHQCCRRCSNHRSGYRRRCRSGSRSSRCFRCHRH